MASWYVCPCDMTCTVLAESTETVALSLKDDTAESPHGEERPYSVIIGGVGVLITGYHLRSHPVGGTYEGISPPNSPV